MTFFNKKEEVLEVVLTRVGREKLATGQFIPTHYEFLDEDVIYDIKYVTTGNAIFEEQNEIKTRTKDQIMFRAQTAKQGAISTGDSFFASGEGKPTGPKPENRLIESLGTFTPYSEYRPAWQIEAVDGNLFTGSGEIDYTPADFTISVKEENVLSSSNQFELEVFKYEYSNNYNNVDLKRLYFEADDITDESVEWYLNVSIDSAVESEREGFVFVDEPLPINDIDDECK